MFLQIQSSKVHFFKEHTLQSRFIQKFTKTAPVIYVNKMGLKLRQFRVCVVKKQCLTRFHDTQGAEVEFPPPKMTQIYLN